MNIYDLLENDESDDDLFAYRNPGAVRVDGRPVNMRSIRIGDIMQSDYPDFVDAYVDTATFRDGTPLSNEEMDQLKDVLVDQGMWEQLIVDQVTPMAESDESDDELFGAEASRKFAICSSDGEILKELENVTVQQAMEMARKMSARFSDVHDELLLIRSDLNGEYDDAQEIPFLKEIDESDMSDDELFGKDSTISRQVPRKLELMAKAKRRTAKRDGLNIQPGTKLLVKWYNGQYYKGIVNRLTPSGRLIVQVKIKGDWSMERNISPHQVKPEHILSESDESDDVNELAYTRPTEEAAMNENDETDADLFGPKSGTRPLFTDEGLPKLDPNTQQRLLTTTNSWLRILPTLSEWRELVDGAGEDTAEKIIADFVKFRDYVKQNNIVAAIGSIQQNAQDYDWDESFQFYIENNTGIDIWDLMDIEDKNQYDAFTFYAGRRRLRHTDESYQVFESLFNQHMNLLTEAELAEPEEEPKPTQTKQKSKLDPNMFGPKLDQPLAKTDPLDDIKKNAGMGGDKPEVNIKKASQADTLKKTSGIGSPEMSDMLSRMRKIDIDPDLDGYPEPEPPETLPSVDVNTKNLPAVAGQALLAAGVQNPDFHQVANLPGNMADMIRQLGKNLFGALTITPTKRIHVVANLGGQGPNTDREVQAVAGFLKEHGEDLGPGDIDFNNIMPGYKAETHMFNAAGIRWMLVKDFAGQYIYCWPEDDSLDAGPKLSNNNDIKQLR